MIPSDKLPGNCAHTWATKQQKRVNLTWKETKQSESPWTPEACGLGWGESQQGSDKLDFTEERIISNGLSVLRAIIAASQFSPHNKRSAKAQEEEQADN